MDAAGEQAAPPRGAAGAGGPQQEWAGGGSDGRRDSWVDTMQPVGSGGCMDGRPSSQGAGGLYFFSELFSVQRGPQQMPGMVTAFTGQGGPS